MNSWAIKILRKGLGTAARAMAASAGGLGLGAVRRLGVGRIAPALLAVVPWTASADYTWTADERLTNDPQVSGYPAVASDPSGDIHVVWHDFRDGNGEIYYKRWDGVAWTPDERLTNDPGNSKSPVIASDPSGKVHVAWWDDRDGNWQEIYYKRWDGVAWTPEERLTNAPGSSVSPSVASDPAGSVHVVWQDTRDGFSQIYYKRWDGVAWTPDLRLTYVSGNCRGPSVASDPSGKVHVVWDDTRYGVFNHDIFYKRWDGVAWTVDERLTLHGSSFDARVASDLTGKVHVVWDDARDGNGEIYYKRWDGVAWTVDERLTNAPGNSAAPSMAADPQGNLDVVWDDNRDGNSEIYRKRGRLVALGVADPLDPTGDSSSPVLSPATLSRNRPNPFNPSTTIWFSLAAAGPATISIYDPAGRLVARPFDQVAEPGNHVVVWDGRAANGASAPPGVYLYQLEARSYTETKKMVLIR